MAMVSVIFMYGRDGSPPLSTRTDDAEVLKSGFYYCPSCEVYGRGTECWWCNNADVQWTYAPDRRALPARIDTRSMRSAWRTPDDLEHWLDDDNIEDELWRAHPRR
ncbi:MAG TPA: hypothetical protein VH112_02340 [Acidimicrobiales bacterium]|jgi:hypothetical protein|nr:hypothetical protein [Acidimicrobiales bacterium]